MMGTHGENAECRVGSREREKKKEEKKRTLKPV